MEYETWAREVTAVHALELSSRCSLRCRYCPSPSIVAGKYPDRSALDMTRETFTRALEWVSYYCKKGSQTALDLTGIGESTLNPNFAEFVKLAREAVGPDVKIHFPTNGTHVTDELVAAIAPYKPDVSVSLHRPEVAGPAVVKLRQAGIFGGVSIDPSTQPNSWAGQVEWADSGQHFSCPWAWEGKLFVMADGRFSRCCLDASGKGAMGHVNDPIGSIKWSPWALCKGCYQNLPPVKDGSGKTWNQKEGAFK